ncbi:MAG: ParA family protein [Aeriscardovia sp.]|nr:ParA family protein [Aeriscardovia sp.]
MAKDLLGREFEPFCPPPLHRRDKAPVIAVVNQKGGVGKTTSTINIAGVLSQLGRKVLAVDFDPQGALTAGLGVDGNNEERTIYDLLFDPDPDVKGSIIHTRFEGLDLLPANIDLSAAEVQLVNEMGREKVLQGVLSPILGDYDAVLIDCQPSLGLLTVNALTAADGVIIPVSTEYFALRGVALLMDSIKKVKNRINPSLEVFGVLPTMYTTNTNHAQESLDRLYEAFGDKLFHTTISRSIKLPDASVAGAPITFFAPDHKVAKEYRDATYEILAKKFIA